MGCVQNKTKLKSKIKIKQKIKLKDKLKRTLNNSNRYFSIFFSN